MVIQYNIARQTDRQGVRGRQTGLLPTHDLPASCSGVVQVQWVWSGRPHQPICCLWVSGPDSGLWDVDVLDDFQISLTLGWGPRVRSEPQRPVGQDATLSYSLLSSSLLTSEVCTVNLTPMEGIHTTWKIFVFSSIFNNTLYKAHICNWIPAL